MLRIGKNSKDQEETDNSSHKPEIPDYSTAKPYSSYQQQGTGVEAKPAPEAPMPARGAMTESESLARDIKEGTLSGFVGGGTDVTGEANFKAMMRVDGHFSGRITSSSGTLIVGNNGKVDANIEVAVAVIHGNINGDIIATQRLELGRAAKVNGNIQTPSLIIEQGAIFEGSCKMVQMQTAAAKAQKDNGKDEPLDTTKMPLRSDAQAAKPTAVSSVSNVVS
jgi:cytoskeletal protein CcmA (bactofilin family)